jgi:hypothetical protein
MREPWSMPIPQAMQQHGSVSKDNAERRDLPVRARKKHAAPSPVDIDRAKKPTKSARKIR